MDTAIKSDMETELTPVITSLVVKKEVISDELYCTSLDIKSGIGEELSVEDTKYKFSGSDSEGGIKSEFKNIVPDSVVTNLVVKKEITSEELQSTSSGVFDEEEAESQNEDCKNKFSFSDIQGTIKCEIMEIESHPILTNLVLKREVSVEELQSTSSSIGGSIKKELPEEELQDEDHEDKFCLSDASDAIKNEFMKTELCNIVQNFVVKREVNPDELQCTSSDVRHDIDEELSVEESQDEDMNDKTPALNGSTSVKERCILEAHSSSDNEIEDCTMEESQDELPAVKHILLRRNRSIGHDRQRRQLSEKQISVKPHISSSNYQFLNPKTKKISKRYKCDVCNKSYSSRNVLSTHKQVHSDFKKYKCNVCNKAFAQNSSLYQHKAIHTGIKKFKCDICNKAFTVSGQLYLHKLIHSGIRKYKCDICSKSFVQAAGLRRHKLIHSGIKNYHCDICNKEFTRPCTLSTHKLAHSNVRKEFKCNLCEKTFTQRSSMRKHEQIHTGVKKYKCDICSKAFMHSGTLSTHMVTHTGMRKYKCDICNKAFTTSARLSEHKLTHTGIKNFVCDICNRAFAYKSILKKHLLVHSGIKNYKCDECNKAFTRLDGLKLHKSRHSSLRQPYECDTCHKLFTNKRVLSKHMSAHRSAIKHLKSKKQLSSI